MKFVERGLINWRQSEKMLAHGCKNLQYTRIFAGFELNIAFGLSLAFRMQLMSKASLAAGWLNGPLYVCWIVGLVLSIVFQRGWNWVPPNTNTNTNCILQRTFLCSLKLLKSIRCGCSLVSVSASKISFGFAKAPWLAGY